MEGVLRFLIVWIIFIVIMIIFNLNKSKKQHIDDSSRKIFGYNMGGVILIGVLVISIFFVYNQFPFSGVFGFTIENKPSLQSKVEDKIRQNLNDPSSLKLLNLYGPYKGKYAIPIMGELSFGEVLNGWCSEIENYTAEISAKNAYGGRVKEIFVVSFKNGVACGIYRYNIGESKISALMKSYCECS